MDSDLAPLPPVLVNNAANRASSAHGGSAMETFGGTATVAPPFDETLAPRDGTRASPPSQDVAKELLQYLLPHVPGMSTACAKETVYLAYKAGYRTSNLPQELVDAGVIKRGMTLGGTSSVTSLAARSATSFAAPLVAGKASATSFAAPHFTKTLAPTPSPASSLNATLGRSSAASPLAASPSAILGSMPSPDATLGHVTMTTSAASPLSATSKYATLGGTPTSVASPNSTLSRTPIAPPPLIASSDDATPLDSKPPAYSCLGGEDGDDDGILAVWDAVAHDSSLRAEDRAAISTAINRVSEVIQDVENSKDQVEVMTQEELRKSMDNADWPKLVKLANDVAEVQQKKTADPAIRACLVKDVVEGLDSALNRVLALRFPQSTSEQGRYRQLVLARQSSNPDYFDSTIQDYVSDLPDILVYNWNSDPHTLMSKFLPESGHLRSQDRASVQSWINTTTFIPHQTSSRKMINGKGLVGTQFLNATVRDIILYNIAESFVQIELEVERIIWNAGQCHSSDNDDDNTSHGKTQQAIVRTATDHTDVSRYDLREAYCAKWDYHCCCLSHLEKIFGTVLFSALLHGKAAHL